MPNRWAVASGNWSNTATWNNGAVLGAPTASDVAYANNQSIYIDTNVTVQALSNAALAGTASVSGSFYLNNAITASTTAATGLISAVSNTPLVYISGSSQARINTTMGDTTGIRIRTLDNSTLTVSGSVFGGSAQLGYGILHTSTGTLYITGSISLGTNLLQYGLYVSASAGPTFILGNIIGGVSQAVLNNSITGSITVYGNVTAGGFSNGSGVINSGGGNLNVYGNVTSNANTGISNTGTGNVFVQGTVSSFFGTNAGIAIANSSTGNVTVIGNVIGSNATSAPSVGISNTSTGIIIVTGSIIGNNAAGISTSGDTYISGSVTAGAAATGISSTANKLIQVIGPITAGITTPGITSTGTSTTCSLSGPFINKNNRNAVYAPNIFIISGSTPTWVFDTETYGEQRTLYTQNYPGNFPSASNVRQGIVFGDTNQFTGTVAIPPTGSVLKGVPVDNTTGSASFDVQSVWGIDTNNLTTTGSLGARLRNVATVATDASAIASKGNL